MKDNWITHNTDKLLLLIVLFVCGVLLVHIMHHGPADGGLLAWAEHTADVVLGALVLILTGRGARSDGQTANGLPPTPESPKPNTEAT